MLLRVKVCETWTCFALCVTNLDDVSHQGVISGGDVQRPGMKRLRQFFCLMLLSELS